MTYGDTERASDQTRARAVECGGLHVSLARRKTGSIPSWSMFEIIDEVVDGDKRDYWIMK